MQNCHSFSNYLLFFAYIAFITFIIAVKLSGSGLHCVKRREEKRCWRYRSDAAQTALEASSPGPASRTVQDLERKNGKGLFEHNVTRERAEGFVLNADEAAVEKEFHEARAYPRKAEDFVQHAAHRGPDGAVRIDASFGENGSASAGRLLSSLAASGSDPSDIGTVVVSHCHGDHISAGYPRRPTSAMRCQISNELEIATKWAAMRRWK